MKLKLPLAINSSGSTYVMSKGTLGVDLTTTGGTTYYNHVPEAKAIELLDNGTWTVVGTKTDEFTVNVAKGSVDNFKAKLDSAKREVAVLERSLATAEANLKTLSKPYLTA